MSSFFSFFHEMVKVLDWFFLVFLILEHRWVTSPHPEATKKVLFFLFVWSTSMDEDDKISFRPVETCKHKHIDHLRSPVKSGNQLKPTPSELLLDCSAAVFSESLFKLLHLFTFSLIRSGPVCYVATVCYYTIYSYTVCIYMYTYIYIRHDVRQLFCLVLFFPVISKLIYWLLSISSDLLPF